MPIWFNKAFFLTIKSKHSDRLCPCIARSLGRCSDSDWFTIVYSRQHGDAVFHRKTLWQLLKESVVCSPDTQTNADADSVYMNCIHTHSWCFWCTLANVERRLGWITTKPNDYLRMRGRAERKMRGQELSRDGFSRTDSPYFLYILLVSCHNQWISQSLWPHP